MNIKETIHNVLAFLGVKIKEVANDIPTVVTLLEKLKWLVDNPDIDAIAAMFIGVENELLIKEALDHVLIIATQGTAIAQDIINAPSAVEKLVIFRADLNKYHIIIQHMNLGKLATLVIHYLSKDGQMTINEATLAVEAEIANIKAA